ncbi:MAG: PilZ domain-containing protein [Sphingomonadaceae bacterium]|jgi:hypothetical protein|nr:MAG: PilZ domain-containing protein [Sphingomonadaceae bacterium]
MDRRRHPRITIFSTAGLHCGGTVADILLLDLSRSGARILLPDDRSLEMNQALAIKLGILPALVGYVSRREDRVYGISLVDTLHPSVVKAARQYCREGEPGELGQRIA